MMIKQLDLTIESRNLSIFQKNFNNLHNVRFPTPLYAQHDILIETYHEGILMNEFLNRIEHSYIPQVKNLASRVAEVGLNAFVKMVFVDNFGHADLHPGILNFASIISFLYI